MRTPRPLTTSSQNVWSVLPSGSRKVSIVLVVSPIFIPRDAHHSFSEQRVRFWYNRPTPLSSFGFGEHMVSNGLSIAFHRAPLSHILLCVVSQEKGVFGGIGERFPLYSTA